MWGYIAPYSVFFFLGLVPSLYVRVYRGSEPAFSWLPRSLIICEGISAAKTYIKARFTFPHYMWGYIKASDLMQVGGLVPSLYVRVYRCVFALGGGHICSLIICEGISIHFQPLRLYRGFPHYMWGYIEKMRAGEWWAAVPSLYVRVYRNHLYLESRMSGSLIICEGISHFTLFCSMQHMFPHYMWGYIAVYRCSW